MKYLEPYLVEFKDDWSMKIKIYPDNYIIKRDVYYSIIVITHNKYIFFPNDRIWKAWTQIRDIFLWPKRKS